MDWLKSLVHKKISTSNILYLAFLITLIGTVLNVYNSFRKTYRYFENSLCILIIWVTTTWGTKALTYKNTLARQKTYPIFIILCCWIKTTTYLRRIQNIYYNTLLGPSENCYSLRRCRYWKIRYFRYIQQQRSYC